MENVPTKECKGCGNEYIPRHDKDYRCSECYSKIGKRSKRRGASNESRFALYLNQQFKKYGFPYIAKRTPRSGGIQDFEPSDILFRFVPTSSIFSKIHFENKNTAQWDVQGWYEYANQKEREMGRLRQPVLIIRKPSSHDEYAVVSMEYMVELLLTIDKLMKDGKET